MQRRDFLRSAIKTSAALSCGNAITGWAHQLTPATAPERVKRVLAMFKCHFDAGFIDTQQHVVERYFQVYFPRAIEVANASHGAGRPYVWTTGSWLLYEYLEQAKGPELAAAEKAIAAGHLAWHALPVSWQTEFMDQSQIEGCLSFSAALDARFGRKTLGAKMTDVPGHTRGLIAPLAKHNVSFLDIGVNGGSRPATLPPMFNWKNAHGQTLTVMYHHEYGAVTQLATSELAVAVIVRDDNSGPHTVEEIQKIYAKLHAQFPDAEIIATDLGRIAKDVAPLAHLLPTITEEIGDSWIYGVPSDPLKVARYREVSRLRNQWIAQGAFAIGDKTDREFLRDLVLEPEHTWGTDTKTWLDFDNYKPAQLASMLDTRNYKVVEYSWEEKRRDLFTALDRLPAKLRDEAKAAIAALEPRMPELPGAVPFDAHKELITPHVTLRLNPETGAIEHLSWNKGKSLASPEHPLALIGYQTLSKEDYDSFFEHYIISHADWVVKDFGKPNIERFGAVSKTWHPKIVSSVMKKERDHTLVLLELKMDDPETQQSGMTAFPERFFVELSLSHSAPAVGLNVSWFNKPATRMPEALWLTFMPSTSGGSQWSFEKSGEPVSPTDVVRAGGRNMHSVSRGFSCDTLHVETLDAPVVALGERSPINYSVDLPDLRKGAHVSLFNNAWGTNYIQWFGGNSRFRFRLSPA